MTRIDNRQNNQLRPVSFIPNYTQHAEGSVLVKTGNTWVLCNASIEEGAPRWREESGGGWLTAEYNMLPRSTHQRIPRRRGHDSSRSREIQRLIGRSLRAAFDLDKLGPYTITIDSDVLQADGGTRTASITGGYVAAAMAIRHLVDTQGVSDAVFLPAVAAISVGIVDDRPMLDLCYEEDSAAEVDLNVVMTAEGKFIEIQGTAEGQPFDQDALLAMLDLAKLGITSLLDEQKLVIDKA
ncbi:MAG: ribonuclease PH [Chloroflexota bacterium]